MEPDITLSFKCPKKLNDLQPCRDNYYCDGCQKTVHDLRGLSAEKITQKFLQHGNSFCGVIESNKVNIIPTWVKWVSAAMLFLGLTSCHKEFLGQVVKPVDTLLTPKAVDTVDQNTFVGFMSVSIDPEFPGGLSTLYNYLAKHITYRKGYSGKVIVSFVIDKDGSVTNVTILKTFDHSIDEELIKVFSEMPKWTRGIKSGAPAKTQFTIPVNFLSEAEED